MRHYRWLCPVAASLVCLALFVYGAGRMDAQSPEQSQVETQPKDVDSSVARIPSQSATTRKSTPSENFYTCGMHPNVITDHSGVCPICSMELTELSAKVVKEAKERVKKTMEGKGATSSVVFEKLQNVSDFQLRSYTIKTSGGETARLNSVGHGKYKMQGRSATEVWFTADLSDLTDKAGDVTCRYNFRLEGKYYILKSTFVRRSGGKWESDDKRMTLEETAAASEEYWIDS